MLTRFYEHYVDVIEDALRRLSVSNAEGDLLEADVAFTLLHERVRQTSARHGFLYFCGNGASAAMASHMSADWLKNGGVRSAVLTDNAMLSAYGNDTGYENTFAGPLSRLGTADDVLVTISSSGTSPNVVKAIEVAKVIGMFVVTLSAFREANPSRRMGDINFYVPGATYGVVECAHQVILHAWLDHYMRMPARLIE